MSNYVLPKSSCTNKQQHIPSQIQQNSAYFSRWERKEKKVSVRHITVEDLLWRT